MLSTHVDTACIACTARTARTACQERARKQQAEAAQSATDAGPAAGDLPVRLAPKPPLKLQDFAIGREFGVEGLYYVPDFVSDDEERQILAGVSAAADHKLGCGWTDMGARRVMNCGGRPSETRSSAALPPFASELAAALVHAGVCDDSDLSAPRPNHILVNEYHSPAGLSPIWHFGH